MTSQTRKKILNEETPKSIEQLVRRELCRGELATLEERLTVAFKEYINNAFAAQYIDFKEREELAKLLLKIVGKK